MSEIEVVVPVDNVGVSSEVIKGGFGFFVKNWAYAVVFFVFVGIVFVGALFAGSFFWNENDVDCFSLDVSDSSCFEVYEDRDIEAVCEVAEDSDVCFYNVAIHNEFSFYCEEIEEKDLRDYCLSRFDFSEEGGGLDEDFGGLP